MKKIIFCLLAFAMLIAFESCNSCTRNWGGSTTIKLEPGEKLIEATWKNNNIWYLVEPMEDDYEPQVKQFKESSNAGLLEGTVTFIETR